MKSIILNNSKTERDTDLGPPAFGPPFHRSFTHAKEGFGKKCKILEILGFNF
jgi:hypothetical protein